MLPELIARTLGKQKRPRAGDMVTRWTEEVKASEESTLKFMIGETDLSTYLQDPQRVLPLLVDFKALLPKR